jgi:hypothetical protein
VLHGLLQVVSRNSVDDAIEVDALADCLGQDRVLVRLGNRGRQQGVAGVVGVDDVAGGPDGGAAQGVQQLADVAGPGVGEQQVAGGDGEALVLEAGLGGALAVDLVEQAVEGQGGIAVALTQRSDAISSGAMAPQLTVIMGRSLRGPAWWMARANSSLPVPDSPSISTGMRRGATRRARATTRCMTGSGG